MLDPDSVLAKENKELKNTITRINKNYEAAVNAGRQMAKELFDRERTIASLEEKLKGK